MVTPAGTARAEDPLCQMIFLTKSAEAVPAASIRRQANLEKQQQNFTASLDVKRVFQRFPKTGASSFIPLFVEFDR
ncbi:hypothetical protein [Halobacillus sp. H74]|uniref:hypothetical protein n=1 Tax=Halobacillus sp. H74 TaxID=3457436 RepID=UPI003FCE4EE6